MILASTVVVRVQAQTDTTVLATPRSSVSTAATRNAMDSAFARARRLVMSGNGVVGRQVGDSILAATREGTEAYGDALFGIATLAATANEAAIDYKRILVEYPLSAHAGDALLGLAQLERSRGDRTEAIAHLQRYLRENPSSPTRATPALWLGQLLFEQNDNAAACSALGDARASVQPADVELANQIDYYKARCAAVAAQRAADSTARADSIRADSVARTTASRHAARSKTVGGRMPTAKHGEAQTTERYTVQVAAYAVKADAERLVATLGRQGVDARVEGEGRPFRVRIGRYKTRGEAEAAIQALKKRGYTGFVATIYGR